MDSAALRFSVVVPTYGRPAQLAACLAALGALHYAREEFEVIVVDDESPEPPREVVEHAADAGLPVRLLEVPHGGPAIARNAGAAAARGRWLAFTDDDCAPAAGWLRALERAALAAPGAAVGGRTVNALDDDVYATASQRLVDFLYRRYDAGSTGFQFFTSNNVALPADRFHAVGGFDAGFPLAAAEDRDLCERWQHHGWPLAFAPDAVVRHAHAMTLRSFARQHFNYGRGAHHLQRARARRARAASLRLESARFYYDLVVERNADEHGVRAAVVPALKALSQVAYGAGYYWERLRAG